MRNVFIKLRKKGVNYYTDYTQRYINKFFNQFGYYQTLHTQKAEMSCKICWDDRRWLLFSAKWLSGYSEEEVIKFADLLSDCFKTKYEIEYDCIAKGEQTSIEYYFTKDSAYAAIDEPPFIQDGPVKLHVRTRSTCLMNGHEEIITVQNYGGIDKGLTVAAVYESSNMEIEKLCVVCESSAHKTNTGDTYFFPSVIEAVCKNPRMVNYHFPEFVFPEGVNVYSTKLIARAKQDQYYERCFHIRFVPEGDGTILTGLILRISANSAPDEVISVCY